MTLKKRPCFTITVLILIAALAACSKAADESVSPYPYSFPTPTPFPVVHVVVAARDIIEGSYFRSEDITFMVWPVTPGLLLPDDFIVVNDLNELHVLDGYVFRTSVLYGQPITIHMLTNKEAYWSGSWAEAPGAAEYVRKLSIEPPSSLAYEFEEDFIPYLANSQLLVPVGAHLVYIHDTALRPEELGANEECPNPPYDIVPWDEGNCAGWVMPKGSSTPDAYSGEQALIIYNTDRIFDAAVVLPFLTKPGQTYRLTVYAQGQSGDGGNQTSWPIDSNAWKGVQLSLCMSNGPDPFQARYCTLETTSFDVYRKLSVVGEAYEWQSYAVLRARATWHWPWNAGLFDQLTIEEVNEEPDGIFAVQPNSMPAGCCDE